MRMVHWAMKPLHFNYEMQYTKGQENGISDARSRLPFKVSYTTEVKMEEVIICVLQ